MKQGEETKNHILQVGMDLILQKGFTGVGISEILKAADVPKGSFYHYFASKEVFGQELIDFYFDDYLARLSEIFADNSLNFSEKLLKYWQVWQENEISGIRCLIVKLSAEVSDVSDLMRKHIQQGMQRVMNKVVEELEREQQAGKFEQVSPQFLVSNIFSSFLGACLIYKVNRPSTESFTLVEQNLKQQLALLQK
ncbi:hypothetical protein CKF54_04460 [Psittacicella hinzii]|uniref:HTH tetR-type domain-containing protein n=1 Tax=Psittacicella hinzii TaxID=2028575 RepID=A0A3A1Y310_9GAMM|nr:TetR/AcrR family transcriptional regulator [Psittacicella hinzii]RIY32712.1 hypothetical protein CKF54_04460 [Psittacicella hinzii]